MWLKLLSLCLSFLICTSALAQKTVLITEGMQGTGKEIALAFRDDGWDVWVTASNTEQSQQLTGIKVRKLDITDSKAIKELYKEIKSQSKTLDVLVNNASLTVLGPEEALTVQQAQQMLAVNVLGPLQMMQEALPMMRTNQGGKIINISSTSGIRAMPGLGMYAASKMALEGLSEALAAEASQWNIWVTVLQPGAVNDSWIDRAQLAANLQHFPGYVTFTNQLRNTLRTGMLDKGQNPQEIATLALQIAKTPKPDFLYQTNDASKSVATQILIDPTGNTSRDRAAAFARTLFDYKS